MKPIRILSKALDLQGEVDNYLSFSFVRRYHFPGVNGHDKIDINGHEKPAKMVI